jgi:peptidoglycan/xylan/chitin deacetylase (PgdA/CDA1 family)
LAAITFDHLGDSDATGALLDIVTRHGVPATWFVTGEQAAAQPALVRTLVDAGVEVGMHGWAHEHWSDLDRVAERDLAVRATDAIADAAGRQPVGFRAPGGERTGTTTALLNELGYLYDASLGDAMTPAFVDGLPNVPFVWPGVDGYWYLRDEPADPSVVRDAWLTALDEAAVRDGVFLTICHPEITGALPERIAALHAVVAAAAEDHRVECCTVGAIAARIPA